MAVHSGVWGIDIGQCALKAIRLQIIDNKLTATAFDYVEHPKILSQPDADPDQLTREALEKFLSRNPIKGDHVAISVPGQSGLARFVKLPPVEERKIDDIVKFEAKQQIPFPLEEVVWDYQKVSDGTVEGNFAIDVEIGLFAMKRDMISRFLNHFQSVKVEVHTVQMVPLALCNYLTYDMLNRGGPDAPEQPAAPTIGKKKCVVGLDIGSDSSSLIITDGGKIIWQRPIPLGGNHFTRALTKDMKLTFAKAEHLKRNAAKSPELPNILKALKPVLTDFVGEVQRSLGYFTNTHRDAQIEYLVGLGSAFRLPGLQKYLGDKLQLKVEKPAKFNRLTGDTVTTSPVFTENLLTFPVAFGLALQGLNIARLGTNLLPPEIAFDRQIRAKKPWAAASAAMLMIGTAFMAYGFSGPYAAVNNPEIPKAVEQGKKAVTEASTVDSQIKEGTAETEKGVDRITKTVAGRPERANWIKLNEYINNALPQLPAPKYWNLFKAENQQLLNQYLNGQRPLEPGMGNMMTRALLPLWADTTVDATGASPWKATEKYFQRLNYGVDPNRTVIEDDQRQYLAAIDVEIVYPRYTTNLKGFFEAAQQLVKQNVGLNYFDEMDKEDQEKLPEGAGWVVEIRGTTWYRNKAIEGPEFLKRTFIPNLKALAKTDPTALGIYVDASLRVTTVPPNTAAARAGLKPGDILTKLSVNVDGKVETKNLAGYQDLTQFLEEKKLLSTADLEISRGGNTLSLNLDLDPVRGKVSHIFLYNTRKDDYPQTDTYQFIGSSVIDTIIGRASGGAGGGFPGSGPGSGPGSSSGPSPNPGPSPGKPGGPGGEGEEGDSGSGAIGSGGLAVGAWTALGSGGVLGTGSGRFGEGSGSGVGPGVGPSVGPGGPGVGPGGPGMPKGSGPGSMPGIGEGEGGSGSVIRPPAKKDVKTKPRYEFVIIFVWREPTPSDKYMPKPPEPTTSAGGQGEGMAGPGGMPGPAPSSP